MQWSLVAAFIPIVNILWSGASAQDCNYTSSLLALGYSKECIDKGQSYMISCSNGEAPPYKECCLAPENITNILTEMKTLRQEMKSAEENSSSVVKSLLQEMKSEIKVIRQEMMSAEENSSSVSNSLLQEMKSERENSVSVIKAIRQEIKSGEENSSSVMKFLLQEMQSEIKAIRLETKSEIKAIRQEMKSAEENSSSAVKSLLQEMQSEMKAIHQEIKSEGENSSSVVKTLLQEMKREWKATMVDNAKQNSAIMASLQIMNPKKNCAELRVLGKEFSGGVQTVYPYLPKPKPVVVFCDQATDGGGWTVIQSRSPLPIRENFYRNWTEYVKGFGDPKGEFWLGLDNIHALTKSAKMELRIDLEDAEGQKMWANYKTFHVGDAASKYVLRIGGYTGDAGNGMADPGDKYYNLNAKKFSTFDNDNDLSPGRNCAEEYKGGWWFNSCAGAHLNGMPIVGKTWVFEGIKWFPFRGEHHSMKKASMRIRPVSLGF